MLLPQIFAIRKLQQRLRAERAAGGPPDIEPIKRFLASLRSLGFIVAGILSAGMGLKGFLLSSHFIDGGVTGVSMLLTEVLHLPLAAGLLLINFPFLLVGYRQMGGWFALKSALAIAGLALCVLVVPFPDVTPDLLLTAVFGGVFVGAGIGLAMRGGVVLDGTEIAALLISRKNSTLKVSDLIMIFNTIIFLFAAFVLGVTEALYSILTYVAASKTLDFVLTGVEQYTGVTIISEKSAEIRHAITHWLGRGVTIYKGESGYGKRGVRQATDIVFTVVTRLELPRLREQVQRLDPHAFIVQHHVDDAVGGMLKRRPLH